jgi:DNA-directed RNA polymerase sigma subunit (sigma70/sigma32)
LDYLVAEKLLNHASAAAQNADFARELPGVVAEVRRMFELHDITNYLAQMERRDREEGLSDLLDDEEDAFAETASQLAARKQRFALIKEFLTRSQLGTA